MVDDARILGFFRRFPLDLTTVFVVTVLVNVAAFAPVVRESALRVVLGIVFVLFVPGYAVVSALFPERERSDRENPSPERTTDDTFDGERTWWAGIDGIDRISLSVALSVTIVPVIGYAMNFTPWGIQFGPTIAVVSLVTIAITIVAAHRRRNVPLADRFRIPYRERVSIVRSSIARPSDSTTLLLNALLIITILGAVASVGYAIVETRSAGSPGDDGYSTLSLLDGGEFAGNETDLKAGTTERLRVKIENHEHQTVTYTVAVVEQRTETVGNKTVIREQRELNRFNVTVDAGETEIIEHEVRPTMMGENGRIVWLLYGNSTPDEPSVDNASRYVYLTMGNETSGNETSQSVAP